MAEAIPQGGPLQWGRLIIAKLRSLSEQSGLRATLAEFDTVLVE
jgi:hypothetical protein